MWDFQIKLNIYFGGALKKVGEEFKYLGELGCKTLTWKSSEIRWEKFESFARVNEFIHRPLSLIYYKDARDGMEKIQYVYDTGEADMDELREAGKKCGELDIYLEHVVSEHVGGKMPCLPTNQPKDKDGEDGIDYGYECEVEDNDEREEDIGDDDNERDNVEDGHYLDGENDDERPREDDEGDKSEDIRRQAMRRISRRFIRAEKCTTVLTPITMALLEKARIENKHCSTIRSSSTLYEVVEFGNGYTVSLSSHQCACRRWDLTGIPCKHAICIFDDNRDDPVRHVADYYLSTVMTNTYIDNIKPVNGENLWKPTNKTPISIPDFRKPRGRPKTRDRRKEPFEDLNNPGKATRHGRTPRCSNCLQYGHMKNGCKNDNICF